MSQYVTIQVKVTDKQAALSALRILGFDHEILLKDDTGRLGVFDWHGYAVQGAFCHIRVPQAAIKLSIDPERPRNDFGINLTTGQVWLDDAVKEQSALGRFVQEYAVQIAMRHHKARGMRVRRVDDPETGKVHVYAD